MRDVRRQLQLGVAESNILAKGPASHLHCGLIPIIHGAMPPQRGLEDVLRICFDLIIENVARG
jgi:hypothetical protein